MSDSEIAFADTGDDAENDRLARQFLLHEERMQANICPNGCGSMDWIDAHNRECPKCGFAGFSTKPFDMKAGEA